jgi:hypothetical protein
VTTAKGLSGKEFIEKIWSAVEEANSRAEGFSRISTDMVAVVLKDGDEFFTSSVDSLKVIQMQELITKSLYGAYLQGVVARNDGCRRNEFVFVNSC